MKNNNKKNNKALKVGIFSFLTLCVASLCIVIFSSGKIDNLEGYMYDALLSLTSATSSNATSCNATSCNATSANATSSNAKQNSNNNKPNNTTVEKNNQKEETKVEPKEEVKEEKKVEEKKEEKVEKKETRNVSYDNENITTEILNQIKTTDEITSVTINAKNNSVIKKEVFSAIKGLDKELVINTNNDIKITMNGKDVKEVKDIDVKVNYTKLSTDVDLKEYADEAIILNFKPNGVLPATAKIKIKITDEMKKTLNDKNSVYVYYYNETSKKLEEIATNIKIQDDSFEFTIKHNSKYIISSTKIEKTNNTVSENNKDVSFLESKKMYILIIGVVLFVIILVLIIVIVDRKKKSKKIEKNGKVREEKSNAVNENDIKEENEDKE